MNKKSYKDIMNTLMQNVGKFPTRQLLSRSVLALQLLNAHWPRWLTWAHARRKAVCMFFDTMDAWREAVENAKLTDLDWKVELNSPIVSNCWRRSDPVLGYYDRFGSFHAKSA